MYFSLRNVKQCVDISGMKLLLLVTEENISAIPPKLREMENKEEPLLFTSTKTFLETVWNSVSWKRAWGIWTEWNAQGNAFWGVTSHTLSVPLSERAPPLCCHHNTINAYGNLLRWWKKNIRSINNVGLWSIRNQDAHQLSTSHFWFLQYTPSVPKARRHSCRAEYAMEHSRLHHISASSAQAELS